MHLSSSFGILLLGSHYASSVLASPAPAPTTMTTRALEARVTDAPASLEAPWRPTRTQRLGEAASFVIPDTRYTVNMEVHLGEPLDRPKLEKTLEKVANIAGRKREGAVMSENYWWECKALLSNVEFKIKKVPAKPLPWELIGQLADAFITYLREANRYYKVTFVIRDANEFHYAQGKIHKYHWITGHGPGSDIEGTMNASNGTNATNVAIEEWFDPFDEEGDGDEDNFDWSGNSTGFIGGEIKEPPDKDDKGLYNSTSSGGDVGISGGTPIGGIAPVIDVTSGGVAVS